jgi:hypothetical protein
MVPVERLDLLYWAERSPDRGEGNLGGHVF